MGRYILVTYTQIAKYPKRTGEKGYWSNPDNMQWDELVEFSTKLKNRDRQRAGVILDIENQNIEKNVFGGDRNWQSLWDYYYKNYQKQIDQFLNQHRNTKV